MKKRKPAILNALFVLLILMGGFYLGGSSKQYDIEQRANDLEILPCYQWQDIEYIIFGEIQE